MQRELEDSEQVFAEWQAAIRHVAKLEDEVVAMSAAGGHD